jgi:hypothetical protein
LLSQITTDYRSKLLKPPNASEIGFGIKLLSSSRLFTRRRRFGSIGKSERPLWLSSFGGELRLRAAQVSKHSMFRYLSGFEPCSIYWATLSSLGGHERPLRFADEVISKLFWLLLTAIAYQRLYNTSSSVRDSRASEHLTNVCQIAKSNQTRLQNYISKPNEASVWLISFEWQRCTGKRVCILIAILQAFANMKRKDDALVLES